MRDIEQFKRDVWEGLNKPLKHISSKYFYDRRGDELFQKIMKMESYYLPECELEIILNQGASMVDEIGHNSLDIIELGAGDGSKTQYLLEQFIKSGNSIKYFPLDISPEILNFNQNKMKSRFPNLEIHALDGDYFKTLKDLPHRQTRMYLFMGSNIGNFQEKQAIDFLKLIHSTMKKGDVLMLGVDLQKNPKTILAAYNDPDGITRQFNLNLLRRINRELDGDFDLNNFDHYPFYNPLDGTTYSFLVSLKDQIVQVAGKSFGFKEFELLHTEISKKYTLTELKQLGEKCNFSGIKHYTDSKNYFTITKFNA
jgi:dimethylhistidine N-methyltransferase